MTAREILTARLDIDGQTAARYCKIAEERVKAYLRCGEDERLSRFAYTVAAIAYYLYRQDQAHETAAATDGLASESFSEGGVAVSKSYEGGAAASKSYEELIEAELDTLLEYRRPDPAKVLRFI